MSGARPVNLAPAELRRLEVAGQVFCFAYAQVNEDDLADVAILLSEG